MARSIAILDTNILDYGFKLEYAESVAGLIKELSKTYDVITVQYSRFELFRGMTSTRVPAAMLFFNKFACIDVGRKDFAVAAALTTCYKNDEATKSWASSFSDGDIIIGATCFVNGASIITANGNDFPRPYFTEINSLPSIVSRKSGRTIAISVLKPNIAYLNENIEVHYPSEL